MINILNFLHKQNPTLNLIELSRENLINNYHHLSNIKPRLKIAPVIKSYGYGHGILEIAKILDTLYPPFFCVDSLYEGYELYKVGITKVLIMGYIDSENLKVKRLPFSYAVFDYEILSVLNEYQPKCGVHIFVDTGMNREGIPMKDLLQFLKKLKEFKNLKIEGLMSHFALSEKTNDPLTIKQINNFKHVQQIVRKAGFRPKYIHIQNSEGLLGLNLKNCNVNIARVGLALYGISNSHIPSGSIELKPVLRLKTKVIQIKNIQTGSKIGYEGTFTATKDMVIGILPIGYYDGVDRRLSNKGWVLVGNTPCRIIGRVSMNITTIDMTQVENPYIGQEVIVYSDNPQDKNSIQNSAKICRTIPYEILVNLASSTRRVVV